MSSVPRRTVESTEASISNIDTPSMLADISHCACLFTLYVRGCDSCNVSTYRDVSDSHVGRFAGRSVLGVCVRSSVRPSVLFVAYYSLVSRCLLSGQHNNWLPTSCAANRDGTLYHVTPSGAARETSTFLALMTAGHHSNCNNTGGGWLIRRYSGVTWQQ